MLCPKSNYIILHYLANHYRPLRNDMMHRLYANKMVNCINLNVLLCICSCPAPKIVFHRLNGQRNHKAPVPRTVSLEGFSAAHEENVKFVHEGMFSPLELSQ